jgi:CheY-like chemotaxis protein
MDDHGQTILVVDDDAAALEVETMALSELGYIVIPSTSGDEALGIASSGLPIDMVLTDLVMPGGMDGCRLASRLRQLCPDVKIAYTSGYVSASASAAMAARGEPILMKPWNFDDLKDFVGAVLAA